MNPVEGLPITLLAPLLLALVYSTAALAYKRAMAEGWDVWRVVFTSNLVTGLMLLPLLAAAHTPGMGAAFHQPVLAGAAFFAGIVLNILALHKGDVSVATPLLGSKVLFVAAFTRILLGQRVEPGFWLAAALAVAAVVLLRAREPGGSGRFWTTVALACGSSLAFSLCDILVQAWARIWSIGWFIPFTFGVVCLLSFGLLPFFSPVLRPRPQGSTRWLAGACVLNGFQTAGIFVCIALFKHPNAATAVNIMYNSRVLWSVLLVWAVGHWFGNVERDQGRRVMAARALGAGLLLGAIILTISGR